MLTEQLDGRRQHRVLVEAAWPPARRAMVCSHSMTLSWNRANDNLGDRAARHSTAVSGAVVVCAVVLEAPVALGGLVALVGDIRSFGHVALFRRRGLFGRVALFGGVALSVIDRGRDLPISVVSFEGTSSVRTGSASAMTSLSVAGASEAIASSAGASTVLVTGAARRSCWLRPRDVVGRVERVTAQVPLSTSVAPSPSVSM